jgi:hypothetical protein
MRYGSWTAQRAETPKASDIENARVEAAVEAVCNRGCRQVRVIIDALERGRAVDGLAHLRPGERSAVLAELKSIMAVYGSRCRL